VVYSLLTLLLLSSVASAQDNVLLNSAVDDGVRIMRASPVPPTPTLIPLSLCWRREPKVDTIMDSAKLPIDFCLDHITVQVVADGGYMRTVGAYTAPGKTERWDLDESPKPMTSYRSGDGSRVYSAYVYTNSNAHGDTGSIVVSVRIGKDGKLMPETVSASFFVGCPQEECLEGDEPGVRTFVSPWR
jgi:hypothetical protein